MHKSIIATSLLMLAIAPASLGQEKTVLVINEICASANIDQWVDPSFNYGGWVELYNPGSTAINITNWYLSDNPDKLKKARITQTTQVGAQEYQTLWFDHYHAKYSKKTIDMKLDPDGGTLYLSDNNGTLQLTIEYPEAVARCSWARTSDGASNWSYCSAPTPGKSNNNGLYASERLEAPVINIESQVFKSGSRSFKVEIPEGCTLRYTTDGSTPTLTHGSNSNGSFTVTSSRIYRFRLFRDGYLPSPVVSRSFLVSNRNIHLPILSVWSTNAHFYGDSLGIFTRGVNGRAGNGQSSKCNWNMDWERPAVFDYFTADGEMLVEQELGVERCGGWSRAWSPFSFKVKANKKYEGENTIDYPFFAEKPYLKHKALQIRNGGNDNGCRLLDPALQQIVATSGIDIDYQAYQPVAHFVNGVWKGTINLREPNNRHFVYANYGYDDDEIDQFEMSPDSGYCQKCGTNEAMKKLVAYAKVATNDNNYAKVCELLDIEEFCNYMAVEFYLRNSDWPQNNLKAWRPRLDEGGRFRFILYDLDGTDWTGTPFTTFAGKQTHRFDNLYGESVSYYTKEIEVVTLFVNLLKNSKFRKQFIDTFMLVAYNVFEPERCQQIITQLASRVAPTQALYGNESPWNTANSLIGKFTSSRQNDLVAQLKSYSPMGLAGKTPQQVQISANIPEAQLLINDLVVPGQAFNGKLFAPITVNVAAPAGYTFAGWKEMVAQSTSLIGPSQSWKYYDKGSLNSTSWNKEGYNDAAWSSGQAPLGYNNTGNGVYKTVLSYGTNANSKRPTYYFRTTFNIDQLPSEKAKYVLDFTVDDGMVVYVNGTEAGRYNMPGGTVSYSTYASSYAPGNPDTGSMEIDASLFKQGENLIAIELHNNSATSTDVYLSAELSMVTYSGSTLVSDSPEFSLPSTVSNPLIACFEPLDNATVPPVRINEVSANNGIYVNDRYKKTDWIELYNTTSQDIDLRGLYLTDDASVPDKWQISVPDDDEDLLAAAILPAHGYRIIWCDDKEAQTQLHAPFKLSNEAGSIIKISAADGSWSDSLVYASQTPNETMGRFPDGGNDIYLFTRPTIDSANRLTQLSQAYTEPSPESIERVLSEDLLNDDYAVYDLQGHLIHQGHGMLSCELPTGIYIVRSQGTCHKIAVP